MATRKRRPKKIDPRLADIIVALRLHALLPASTQKAVTRLRGPGTDRDRVLGEALHSVLPMDALPLLLKADGLDARGDWLGVYIGVDTRLRMIDSLIRDAKLGRDPVGLALMWRLAFFELATRIGAAAFAKDPQHTPHLRHDLWAAERGFGLFLDQLFGEHGLKRGDVVEALVRRRLVSDDVEKSLFERWYYEDKTPQAENVTLLAHGIAIAVRREDDLALRTTLRMRIHLFIGARAAHAIVGELLGPARAQTLATTFAKQVHTTLAALRKSAAAPPTGANGPVPPDAWLDERRRFARSAAFFGILPASPGGWLLQDTHDVDFSTLTWPPTSMFFEEPSGHFAQLFEERYPGYIRGRRALRDLVGSLTLDDCVSDASIPNADRQPLGLLGLLDRVLGMRLPI